MTTWYAHGSVSAPNGPDLNGDERVYGYDNGAYFGPRFASLQGDPFLVTWTTTGCISCFGGPGNPYAGGSKVNPVTDVLLTVNGVTIDLGAYHNIWWSGVSDQNGLMSLRMMTTAVNPVPPWGMLPFYDIYTGMTFANEQGIGAGGGSVRLVDNAHVFQTNMQLSVTAINQSAAAVPGPVEGAGPLGLAAAIAVLVFLAHRRKHLRHA